MKAHDVKRLVAYYVKKYNTRNPFELADYLGVEVQTGQLGESSGFYMFLKNHKCVFLNEDLEEHERTLVMAHELAHSIDVYKRQTLTIGQNRIFPPALFSYTQFLVGSTLSFSGA